MAGTAVGTAILSATTQVLLEKLSTAALTEIRLLRGVAGELENLSSTLSTIQAFLEDAEEKQLTDKSVRSWLTKLKDVVYDSDDLLDKYAAEALRSKVEGQAQSRWKKVCDCFSCSCWKKGLFHCKIAHKVKAITERLDKIAKERDTLGLQVLDGTRRLEITERPQTSSLVDDSNVFGREKDRENVVNLLLSNNKSSPNNVSVLPIVGMGGLGKTTLTQLVYNDDRVKEYFQVRIWVCVSENFDERKLTKEIFDSTTSGNTSLTTNINMLQENLHQKLKGKRFLLVLDDVWNENQEKWQRFRNPLIAGEKGSKIVVTTQNENVGKIMGALPPYRLKRLSESDSWSLFRKCAFVEGSSSEHPKLEKIGKEIVKKLKGLPLAVKTLGSLLYSKLDENDWKDILKSEIWELPPDKNNVLPALRLSYKHLPPHLKQCFAFCSVFHKDYVFEKDKLVQIWMALGFIQPQRKKRMEDVGNSYFDDLLSRSFFQLHKGNYMMHDAIHDLAQSISVDECLRLEDDERSSIHKKTRHLSFSCDNSKVTIFEAFYEFKGLRTLLLLRGYKSRIGVVPDDLFLKLRCIRVLDLYRRDIQELPYSIGNLKQLRYLGLSGTRIKTLPLSISRLYTLQTLDLKDCNSLNELPKGVTNLINLRHLIANDRLISKIAGIGKLTCLQELEKFVVCKERGHKIIELKELTELRGALCIQNLENVVSGKEASEAKLNNKEYLSMLDLEWENERRIVLQDECLDEAVLEALQPHPDLRELTIKGYAGVKFPCWLGSPSLSNLQTIRLSSCRKCKLLPPLGQLPFLRYLEIIAVHGVIRMAEEFSGNGEITGFPSLKELVLEELPDLEEWLGAEEDQLFPCLTDLEINDCPKLRRLPNLPPALTRLRISEAGLSILPKVWGPNTPSSSSLSSLYISDCPNLTSLGGGLVGHQLRALEDLKIINCEELVSLLPESFQTLVSLESLHIYNCPKMVSWTQEEGGLLPRSLKDLRISSCSGLINPLLAGLNCISSLTRLEIADCPGLTKFPEGLPITLEFLGISDCTNLQFLPPKLPDISSLATLMISNCPQIPSLPEEGLPSSLQELYIKKCPLLQKQCEEGGKDWPKIAGISNVEIDENLIYWPKKSEIPDVEANGEEIASRRVPAIPLSATATTTTGRNSTNRFFDGSMDSSVCSSSGTSGAYTK